LELINSNFGPGDKIVATQSTSSDVLAQASITAAGRKVLLVNSSNKPVQVSLAGVIEGSHLKAEIVDEASGENAPRKEPVTGAEIKLAPFAVAVVSAGSK